MKLEKASLDFVLIGPALNETTVEPDTRVACGITLEMVSPEKNAELVARGKRIELSCGHFFAKGAIQHWYNISPDPKCPNCSKPIAGRDVRLVPKAPHEEAKAVRRQLAITSAVNSEEALSLEKNKWCKPTSVFLMSERGIKEMRFPLTNRNLAFKG